MLNVNKVSKRFGRRLVLSEVSFSMEKGSVLAVCGPSRWWQDHAHTEL